MIIRTYKSDYIVIKHVQSSSVKDVYICRKNRDSSGKEYTIICIKNMDVSQRLLLFFSKRVDQNKFTDFIETFTFEGKLNFVFEHSSGMLLEDKLAGQRCSFAERLEIAYKLMERMIYLDMPFSFQADALLMPHIVVTDALDVRFRYEMEFLSRLEDYTVQEVGIDIGQIFCEIFEPELEKMSCPEIIEFLEWLSTGEYETYLDIFYKFHSYYQVLLEKPEEQLAEPQTKVFKLWERIKRLFGKLKVVLMIAFLAGALSYLTISVIELLMPDPEMDIKATDHYDSIGTLKIRDAQEEDAAPSDNTEIQRSRME